MPDQPNTEPNSISDEAAVHLVDAYDDAAGQKPEAKAARMMTDAFLVRTYQRNDGEPGNPEADALLAEIERRGLAV